MVIVIKKLLSVIRTKYSFSSLFTFLMGLVLLFSTTVAYATYPDITGTWTGTATGTDFNCIDPADDGPFTDSVTAIFSNQVNGNFD